MDYKELIELSKKAAAEWKGTHEYYQAATLIMALCEATETLLTERDTLQDRLQDLQITLDMYGGIYGINEAFRKAEERDAAVEDLMRICQDNPDVCQYCKHMPCTEKHGRCIGWEWRGPKVK